MPRPIPDHADRRELERRYLLEKGLAERLRQATPEQRAERYSVVYAEYARSVESEGDDPGSLELQRRLLAPWLRPGMSLVEIGAGSGAIARSMLGENRSVVAIEAVVPEEASSITWLRHDQTAEINPGSMDLAYSCHVVEHLHPDDLPGHLADVLRWLRPGAAYLMVTPNRLLGPHDISAYFAEQPEGLHLREYSHTDLARAARLAGFARLMAVDQTGDARPLWPRWLAETALELCGGRLRRLLFDGISSMSRRAPLRPLEQVVLAAFAPDHDPPPSSRDQSSSSPRSPRSQ